MLVLEINFTFDYFRGVQESGPQVIKNDKLEKKLFDFKVRPYTEHLLLPCSAFNFFSKSLANKCVWGGVKNVAPLFFFAGGHVPLFSPVHTLLMQMDQHCSLHLYCIDSFPGTIQNVQIRFLINFLHNCKTEKWTKKKKEKET